jgi:DNA-3-methyladenine glycosylase
LTAALRTKGTRLRRSFYSRPTIDVARDLLGKVLVRASPAGVAAGLIVEAEAYIGEADPACHASPGPTNRNQPLYGEPGYAYVYLNYGIHYLVNAVTEPQGSPAAVLIRALEPLDGIPLMRRRRARGTARAATSIPVYELCRGPGNLTRALGITLAQNRADLCGQDLWIEDRGDRPASIAWSRRIGITAGVEQEWRCYVEGSKAVSSRASRVGGASRVGEEAFSREP